jgi:5-epi-alpha-selinene synthase
MNAEHGLAMESKSVGRRHGNRVHGHRVRADRDIRGVHALGYPWAARRNRAVAQAEAAARDWVSAYELVTGEAATRSFEQVGVGALAAYAYPDAEPLMLELIAEVMAWVFIQDDVHDTAAPQCQRPERVRHRFDRYLEIVRTGRVQASAEPAAAALADLSSRLIALGSPAWHAHFVETMRRFWMDGLVVETYYRSRGLSPDPASYMAMRVETVGVYVCLDLLELTMEQELPSRVRADPILRRITWLTSRIIAYVNDVFSYDKEVRAGDVNNYLHVVRRSESMSLAGAIDRAVRVHDRELAQFCQLGGTLMDYGPDARRAVERYMAGCRSWMTGALRWQQSSRRYASGRVLLQQDPPLRSVA